jgi:hypothetical protein
MPEAVRHFVKRSFGLLWRLAVYFAVLVAALRLLSVAYRRAMHDLGVHFAQSPAVRPAEGVGLGQSRLLLAAVLAWLITARLGRDRPGRILPLHATAAAHLLQGLLWGFAGVAATLGAIACFGGFRVSGFALSGTALAYYLPLWLAVAVVNGLAENLAVMGYPLFRVASDTGWVPAILLVGLLFAAAHLGNPGENPLGIASVFLGGVTFATTIWLTGNLWLSVGIHAGMVLAEDLVFSVPDSGAVYTGHVLVSQLTGPAWLSGGDAGPEGSVLALPVFAVMFVLLWVVYRRRPNASTRPAADIGSTLGGH